MADIRIKFKLKNGGEYDLTPAKGLKSFDSLNQTTASPDEIFYGVIPGRGAITAVDSNGEIAALIKNSEISKDTAVEVWENGKQKAAHIVENSSYSIDKKVSISLVGTLAKWDKINYSGHEYSKLNSITLYDITKDVFKAIFFPNEATDTKAEAMFEKMPLLYVPPLSKETLGNVYSSGNVSVKGYLQSFNVLVDYISAGTLRETIDKICVVAQLQCIGDETGNPVFVMARPIAYIGKSYSVSPSMLLALPQKNLVRQNAISNIKIAYKNAITGGSEDVANYEQKYIQGTAAAVPQSPSIYSLGNYQITYDNLIENNQKIEFINYVQMVSNYYIPKDYTKFTGYLKLGAEQIYRIRIRTRIQYNRDLGLKEFLRIGENVDYSVSYTHKKGTLAARAKGNTLNIAVSEQKNANIGILWFKNLLPAIPDCSFTESAATTEESGSGQISSVFEYDFKEAGTTLSIATTSAFSPIQIQVEDGVSYLYTTAIVGRKTYVLNTSAVLEQTSATELPDLMNILSNWTGEWEEFVPNSITITFKGQMKVVSFEDAELASANFNDLPTIDIGSLGGNTLDNGYYIAKKTTPTTETFPIDTLEAYYQQYDFDFLSGEYRLYSNLAGQKDKLVAGKVLYQELLTTSGYSMAELVVQEVKTSSFTCAYTKFTAEKKNVTGTTYDFIKKYQNNILSDYANGISTATAEICNTDIKGADLKTQGALYQLSEYESVDEILFSETNAKYAAYSFDDKNGTILFLDELNQKNIQVGDSFYTKFSNAKWDIGFFTVTSLSEFESGEKIFYCSGIEYVVTKIYVYELLQTIQNREVLWGKDDINQNLYTGYSFNEDTGELVGTGQTTWGLLNTGDTFYYLEKNNIINSGEKTAKSIGIGDKTYVYSKNVKRFEIFAPLEAKYDLVKKRETDVGGDSLTTSYYTVYDFDYLTGVIMTSYAEPLSDFDVGDVVFGSPSGQSLQKITITQKTASSWEGKLELFSPVKRAEQQNGENGIAETLKWANGETLKLGDVVRIDKDNNNDGDSNMFSDTLFKVTGIKHKYDGVPTQDLELQEIK